ncbi:hypothetical protein [Streptomyces klenkii]|uniref:hypothetical protein n=1 Tax=Streptomyces klenkii TaxID=1420899 RepID=UPI003427DAB1
MKAQRRLYDVISRRVTGLLRWVPSRSCAGPARQRWGSERDQLSSEAAAGVERLEGYLLWEREIRIARENAQYLVERLPELDADLRDEVVQAYTECQLESARTMFERTAARAQELQCEYSIRYQTLRTRIVAFSLFSSAVCVAVSVIFATSLRLNY